MSKYGKPIWQYVFEAAKELRVKTFAPIDVIRKVHETNPEIPSGTIRSYVIAMAPNHPSSKHHPSTRRLHNYFEYLGNGRFQLAETPLNFVGIEDEITIEEDLHETAISLEQDLETFIFKNINSVEEGLTPYKGKTGRQFSIETGRIDILSKDRAGRFVVIELKAGTATDSVLTQTLSYMANIKDLEKEKEVRGIIIAHDFSNRLKKAASLLQSIELMKYKVGFEFELVK